MKYILETFAGVSNGRFDPLWLVVVGIVWLIAVVLWAATRPGEAERVRKMERLKQTILNVIPRFEKLSRTYEECLTQSHANSVFAARLDLMYAVAAVITAALETLPEERRHEYTLMLRRALLDHLEFFQPPSSLWAEEISPTYAIQLALGMHKSPSDTQSGVTPPSQPSPAPPASTA